MPFGLTIGTERAIALQNAIQDELMARGYSPDADPVMAEYITIMIINNKTPAQITSELEDLIGSDFDRSFTDWLFVQAAKDSDSGSPSTAPPPTNEQPSEQLPARDNPPHSPSDAARRLPNAPRGPLYQQAISQTLPSTSTPSSKRTSSARSPSPNHPNKSRRTDLPTGPRAMQRDGNANSRSLLERVGGPVRSGNAGNRFQRDDIQARIDSITNSSPEILAGGFPPMNGGMDMNAMGMAGMTNPLLFQEVMMNQMALMAQMASSMGMLGNPAAQFVGAPGFPMQGGMPGDMNMFPGAGMNGFAGPQQHIDGGRGGGRGGRNGGRGRGGPPPPAASPNATEIASPAPKAVPPPSTLSPATSTNFPPAPIAPSATSPTVPPPAVVVGPERPQSPTLCKFGLKCTHVNCRYSHPSPVATVESGVVLSNEPCENGRACKDKDCIKGHVSPAVLTAPAPEPSQSTFVPPIPTSHAPPLCKFGPACTRPNCQFLHPTPRTIDHFAQQCRFGSSCTRATCPFQHPEGRVLPTTFHRGLSNSSPMVTVPTPETGSLGGHSPHKSVTFNTPGSSKRVGDEAKAQLEKRMSEVEAKKNEAEKAVKEAEAAHKKELNAIATIAA